MNVEIARIEFNRSFGDRGRAPTPFVWVVGARIAGVGVGG
jgi:hypothetical protein